MAFSFFSKLFKKKASTIEPINALITYAEAKSFLYFHHKTIYHLDKSISSKLLLVDPHYGLYLIDSVNWKYDDIKDAKVSNSHKKSSSNADVQVDLLHDFIVQKFNEVLHSEVSPIINILYLSNITKEMYDTLDDSFHALLPSKRLVFKNSTHDEICEHLHQDIVPLDSPIDTIALQSALFIDSTLHTEQGIKIANAEQKKFIAQPLEKLSSLQGAYFSGKTHTILLKIIYEILNNPTVPITLITSTQYACDTIRKKLLEMSEYAIVDIDVSSIRVLTTSSIGSKVKGEGILFCDDVQLYSKAFIEKLLKMKNSYTICFVGTDVQLGSKTYTLTHNYEIPPSISYANFLKKVDTNTMTFYEGNIYMHSLLILQKLFQKDANTSILIVVDEKEIGKKIRDEINDYYDNICAILDTTFSIIQLERKQIEIVDVHQLSMFSSDYVILVLSDLSERTLVEYALSRAKKHLYCIGN